MKDLCRNTGIALILLVPSIQVLANEAQHASPAQTACLVAVNREHGDAAEKLTILTSKPSPGGTEVVIEADGKRWQCRATRGGEVKDLREAKPAPQDATSDQ